MYTSLFNAKLIPNIKHICDKNTRVLYFKNNIFNNHLDNQVELLTFWNCPEHRQRLSCILVYKAHIYCGSKCRSPVSVTIGSHY